MYRVLIVDDEPLIARGMQRAIERLEFFTAETAFSGAEAMDRLDRGGVDAMLLDINMPGMSGLDVLKRLSERGSVPPTVIISGYEDFDFAKRAMTSGAIDYLLKPVSPRDVAAIGMRLYERLEADRRAREEDRELRAFVSAQRDVIKQRLLADILSGSVDPSSLEEYRRFYGLDLRGEYCTAAIVRVARRDYAMGELDFQTAIARARAQIERVFEEVPEAILFNMENARFALIISATEPFDAAFLDALLERTADAVEAVGGIEVFIGRGEEVRGLAAIGESYQGALDAMDYRAMFAHERVYAISDFHRDPAFNQLQRQLTRLDEALRHLRFDDADALLESFHGELSARTGGLTDRQAAFLLNRLSCVVMGAMLENGLMTPEPALKDPLSPGDGVAGLEDRMYIWARSMLEAIRRETLRAFREKNRGAAQRVWEHVRAHYAESDLNVNGISAALGYSPNCLGNAFKREYGDSINEFINRCRVEAAEALIRGSDRRIYDIAFAVGFNDEHYFSRTFKRYAGCSPSEYRSGEGEA